MNKYIIVELIPTSLDPSKGDIIQLSALKINNLELMDRFDYRLNEDKIPMNSLKEMINYDKNLFNYKNSTKEILDDFNNWANGLPLLIIDNSYTLRYLENISNSKESIFNHLHMKYNDNIISEIMEKYNLEFSNYIVDLLYEALIYESNNSK